MLTIGLLLLISLLLTAQLCGSEQCGFTCAAPAFCCSRRIGGARSVRGFPWGAGERQGGAVAAVADGRCRGARLVRQAGWGSALGPEKRYRSLPRSTGTGGEIDLPAVGWCWTAKLPNTRRASSGSPARLLRLQRTMSRWRTSWGDISAGRGPGWWLSRGPELPRVLSGGCPCWTLRPASGREIVGRSGAFAVRRAPWSSDGSGRARSLWFDWPGALSLTSAIRIYDHLPALARKNVTEQIVKECHPHPGAPRAQAPETPSGSFGPGAGQRGVGPLPVDWRRS